MVLGTFQIMLPQGMIYLSKSEIDLTGKITLCIIIIKSCTEEFMFTQYLIDEFIKLQNIVICW